LGYDAADFLNFMTAHHQDQDTAPDVREKGRDEQGEVTALDRRLYVQLLAFGACADPAPLTGELEASGLAGALYADMCDPRGVALVVAHEDAGFFTGALRSYLNASRFARLPLKPEYTMTGRTYTLGHEHDLEHVLITRPLQRICNPEWPWAVWYPLRRSGSFEVQAPEDRRSMLMEHGRIGAAYGEADLARDIRLACHGLDKNDNEFVVGLVGRDLHPLSAVVQAMRRTRQTAQHMEKMGPFFVGRAVWQSALED
jgi:chlorite dismutase